MSSDAKSLGPPFPLSVFTRVADPLRTWLLPVDADRVMRLAERLNGLDDYGGGGFQARFEETMESALRVDWNALGRFGLRYIFNWHLGNRLRLVELFKQRPGLLDVKVERPIIITGLFRTGTTYLHNLLASHPQSRAPLYWELMHPCPAVDPRTINPKKLINY